MLLENLRTSAEAADRKRTPEQECALLRGLTVSSGEAAGTHAAFVASLQRRPAVRSEPPRLQVPQLQRLVPRRCAQEVPVAGEAAG